MMRFSRPEKPAGFDSHVSAAKRRIADLVAAGARPKSDDFVDRWGSFKLHFTTAQHRKCAFCESKTTHVDPGDVEHYRPKAAITALPLDREKWGHEIAGTGNAEGRSPEGACEWGYHFLAYDWSNYLFACGRCNRAWKGNLFPVSAPRTAEIPTPQSVAAETPLLLNPYDPPDPTQHLQFVDSVIGQVEPRRQSAHGRATIDTCHLDRASLVDARREKAAEVLRRLKELRESIRESERDTEAVLEVLRRLGDPSHAYAGLVRATFERWMEDLPWEEAFGPDDLPSPPSQTTGSSE